MNILKSIFKAYLYSSLHISLMGFVLYLLPHIAGDECIQKSTVFGLGIFIYYNLSRIIRVKNYEDLSSNPHLIWVSKNLTELLFCIGFALCFILILCKEFSFFDVFHPICFILGLIYLFCRKISYLKNLIIAFVWTIPLVFQKLDSLFRIEFLCLFVFFFVISVLYDQKDKPENQSKELIYLFWVDLLIMIPGVIKFFILVNCIQTSFS